MFVLAIDQSTSATKAMLFQQDGKLVIRHDLSHRQIINEKGWIAHDPMEIYRNTVTAAKEVVKKSGVEKSRIAGIAISNQRETAVCWDRTTGKPVYDAIVWQCGRAADITDALADHQDQVRANTGLNLSPYFSAARFAWIVKHVTGANSLLQQGKLCCGTIDSWLLFQMTGGASFQTDVTNASRTQLLNLDTLSWDDHVMKLFGLSKEALPEICHSDACFGYTDLEGFFDRPIPIHAMIGDSHGAMFANGCLEPMTAKATFGTGTSVMMNVGGRRAMTSEKGIVESVAFSFGGNISYALEGNINYSGAIIQWLVDDLELIASPKQAGGLAASVDSTNGVYLIPAFSGLGAPYWDSSARAAICGMHRGTKKAHIVRAAEEAIAYQIKDIFEEIKLCSELPHEIAADGGATRDTFLMQFVADILGIRLRISDVEELSAAGAAYLALMGLGLSGKEQLFSSRQAKWMLPNMEEAKRAKLYMGWKHTTQIIMSKGN